MQVAELIETDTDLVVALWQRCDLTRPWNDPIADIAHSRRATDSIVLIGREAGSIIASVMVGFDGHRGWVYYLAVDLASRRRGCGRAMMAAAETWLRERGVPKLQLMVRDDNIEALGFYASLGLEPQSVVTLGKRLDGRT